MPGGRPPAGQQPGGQPPAAPGDGDGTSLPRDFGAITKLEIDSNSPEYVRSAGIPQPTASPLYDVQYSADASGSIGGFVKADTGTPAVAPSKAEARKAKKAAAKAQKREPGQLTIQESVKRMRGE